jgi:PelA/Pel-15E family pectate lyase
MRHAIRRRRAETILLVLGVAMPTLAQGSNPNPMDSIRKLPGYRGAHDSTVLLAPNRIAKYAAAKSGEWAAYVARSREQYARDTAAMSRELRSAGKPAMVRAMYTHDFSVKPSMSPAWFAGDSAQRMARVILSFQAPNGGWSKHVDFTAHERTPGESYFAESADWEWISTIDNDATTEEIHFLARASEAHHDARYESAIRRAIDYLLDSQFPNGCLPQVYPLEGSYHDAATFNDNASVNVLRVFQETANGVYKFEDARQRERASTALRNGIDCIVNAQVRAGGRLTAWGQQHDPLTLEPTSARSYELASLASLESAFIVDFLMSQSSPSEQVLRAVYAAVDWLRAVPISGFRYAGYQLTKDPSAPSLWGRLYEIKTNRVIMANRDGVKLYDWNKLTDRRSGYGWYTTKPAETLATFEQWSRLHPRKP